MGESIYSILIRALFVNSAATFSAGVFSIPLALYVDTLKGRKKEITALIMQTLTGIPPVVVGLFVYLLLSRRGLLGRLELLFTNEAMIIAQFIIAFPIIFTLSFSNFSTVDKKVRLTAATLGATKRQTAIKILQESGSGIIVSLMTAFGRLAGEVGAVMIVGGNIEGRTRILTTSIVLYTSMGEFEKALVTGIILLGTSFGVNAVANIFSKIINQNH